MRTLRDPRFIFFAAGAALALLISAPFTYAIVSPFHQAGLEGSGEWAMGAALSVALVILLEAGAVGAKIARVGWLSVALLTLTFIGNLVTGSDYWTRAGLAQQPMLAAWRASWLGWLPPILYAAIVPVLLYTFLHFAIERASELIGGQRRGVADEVRILRADVRTLSDALLELVRTPAALPEQVSYPRPELQRTQPVLMPPEACPVCSHPASKMQLRTAAQHSGYICKGCGKRVAAQ